MRWARASLFVVAMLGLAGCAVPLVSQQAPVKFTAGFWFWNTWAEESEPGPLLDVLFVHAGTIAHDNRGWSVYGGLPNRLPAAREYWVVFRYERQGVPDLEAAPIVAEQIAELQMAARRRNLNLAGVQLDIDSPTGSLAKYAAFVRDVRKWMPQGWGLSITALLDWFRTGTEVAKVIAEVDEFVPQFYDIDSKSEDGGGRAIAARIDAVRWGPVFNRFRKGFRVGISTFGRARVTFRQTRFDSFSDLGIIDIAANPAFGMQSSRNEASELVLTYRATRDVEVGYHRFKVGDTVQFILATPEMIRAAVGSARQMGGHVAGVVFFRWAGEMESLAMQPEEVLSAAGLAAQGTGSKSRVEVVDGRCATVACVDVYVEGRNPFAPHAVRYRIRSSSELDYFLPEQDVPARLSGPAQVEVTLPPYCARGRLYIGRAVSSKPAEFTVEEER